MISLKNFLNLILQEDNKLTGGDLREGGDRVLLGGLVGVDTSTLAVNIHHAVHTERLKVIEVFTAEVEVRAE